MRATLEQEPAERLFDPQAELMLPAGPVSARTPEYHTGILDMRKAQQPQQPQSPIKYTATVFEQDWVPDGENALQSVIRKTTIIGTVLKLPGGYKLKCGISPLRLAGGCGVVSPSQLSRPLKVRHKRDNLLSATPLVKPATARLASTKSAPASSARTAAQPDNPAASASAGGG